MGRKAETFKIKDGSGKEHSVEIYQMSVTDSLRVQSRLAKVFSGPLSGFMKDLLEKGKVKKSVVTDGEKALMILLESDIDVQGIVGNIFENMDEDILIDTMKLISSQIIVDGIKMDLPNLESYDSFGIPFMYKTIGRALKVNYSSFFVELLGSGADQEKNQKPSKG